MQSTRAKLLTCGFVLASTATAGLSASTAFADNMLCSPAPNGGSNCTFTNDTGGAVGSVDSVLFASDAGAAGTLTASVLAAPTGCVLENSPDGGSTTIANGTGIISWTTNCIPERSSVSINFTAGGTPITFVGATWDTVSSGGNILNPDAGKITVPALPPLGLGFLGLTLAGTGFLVVRRKRTSV